MHFKGTNLHFFFYKKNLQFIPLEFMKSFAEADIMYSFIFGSIVYYRAIVHKRQNFLKVDVNVIIIDQ